MKKIVLSKQAPAPIGPYSQAVEHNGFLFCSGQIALDLTGNVVPGDVKNQAEQVMKNIEAVLVAAQMSFKNVIKTTIYLVNMQDFSIVNEIYGRYFPENPPARSTIAVAGLPKGVQVEIEITAAR